MNVSQKYKVIYIGRDYAKVLICYNKKFFW